MMATLTGGAFLMGLLGGVHCAGMCGGVVLALCGDAGARPALALGYNLGRIGTYGLLGALAGSLGGGMALVSGTLSVQLALYIAAQVMLIALGAYLAGYTGALRRLEALGAHLWPTIGSLAKALLPGLTPLRAVAVGSLWGFLPCAMVYSLLVTASVSGSALRGALVMLAFGAGTLPTLLLSARAARRLRGWVARPRLRMAVGALVAAFGVVGLVRAEGLAEAARRGLLCLTV